MLDIISIITIPNMSIMIFIFLCFLGLFVMFLCVLREQSKLLKTVRHELAENKAALQAIEQCLLRPAVESDLAPSATLPMDFLSERSDNAEADNVEIDNIEADNAEAADTEIAKNTQGENNDLGTNYVQAFFVRNEIPEYDNAQAPKNTQEDDDDEPILGPGSSLSFVPYTEKQKESMASDVPLHVTSQENSAENSEEPYLLGRPIQPQSLQMGQDADMSSSSPGLDLYMPPPKR